MRQHITESLSYKITNDAFDMRLGQVACFVAGVLVLAISFWKLTVSTAHCSPSTRFSRLSSSRTIGFRSLPRKMTWYTAPGN